MKRITQQHLKNFNDSLFQEEYNAALPGRIVGMAWSGFVRLNNRIFEPAAETRVIGTQTIDGVTIEFTADPGDLSFSVVDDFSPAEETTLNGLCIAHDYTLLTAEQERQDQDQADYLTLWNAYQNWATLTDEQFKAAMKIFLRVVYRKFKGGAI